MLEITPLLPTDRARWNELWLEYQKFYRVQLPDDVTEATWQRILRGRVHAVGARQPGQPLIGIVHYLFHEDTWSTKPACYLQDLYVDPVARGTGCGRKLIETVAEAAKVAGTNSPYWLTHHTNQLARQLYDRLAQEQGFLQYIYTTPASGSRDDAAPIASL